MIHELPPPPAESAAASAWERAARDVYRRIAAAFRFELRRSLSVARMSAWIVLVGFPVAIMAVFRYHDQPGTPEQLWGIVLYLLAAQSTTLLGLLLWVAPALQSELESRTWTYVSVRPGGKLVVLFGKYLSGVAWTVSAGIVGLVVSVIVVGPIVRDPLRLLMVLSILQVLAAFAYGALYLAIGTLFPRRSMVFAVAYTLIFEVIVSVIPATIQQITVQHRLWNLLWAWMSHWDRSTAVDATLSSQRPGTHLLILLAYSLALLAVASAAVRKREYLTSSEV